MPIQKTDVTENKIKCDAKLNWALVERFHLRTAGGLGGYFSTSSMSLVAAMNGLKSGTVSVIHILQHWSTHNVIPILYDDRMGDSLLDECARLDDVWHQLIYEPEELGVRHAIDQSALDAVEDRSEFHHTVRCH